jgi:hypothetical protein
MDLDLGRSLPTLLADAGLTDVAHEGIARIITGGTPWSSCYQKTWRLVDDSLVDQGLLSATDVAACRQAHDDPTFQYRDFIIDAVWGRRPSRAPEP